MTEERVLSPREKETLKLFARLQRLASGLNTKGRSELVYESEDTDISLSALNVARAFSKGSSLSDRDLFLLRDVVIALKRSPAHRSISTLLVNEDYIAETYSDMMSKRACIDCGYKTPCNISRLLSLGSDAVSFYADRSYVPSDVEIFATQDTQAKRIDCALKGYFPTECDSIFKRKDVPIKKHIKRTKCQAAIIYTRDTEMASALEEFCSHPQCINGVVDAFACKPKELFTKLSALDEGFSINADALPEVSFLSHLPREYRSVIKSSLSFFENAIFGETAVVITAKRSKLDAISSLARSSGLSVCRAISFKSSKEYSITTQNKVVASLGGHLVSTLRDLIGHTAEIATQKHDCASKELNIEKIYVDTADTSSAYKATVKLSDSQAPYHDTLYAALGLILRARADGFSFNNSDACFSVSASLCLTDAKATGTALAAILALYRIQTEFCIPEKNSSIENSDEESAITLYLKLHSTKKKSSLDALPSIEPILFDDLDENGLPNLKIIKKYILGELQPYVTESESM